MLKSRLLSSVKILPICALAAILPACGGGSGGGSSVPPPPPPPPPPPAADTVAPTVSFSPDSLTVESGATGSSTLTATDNVGVTSGPTVTCTNGGSFSDSTFTAPTVTATTTSVCTATASDAAGNSATGTLTVRVRTPQEPPVASATADKSFVLTGQNFILDASDSTDPNDDELTYLWRQTSGTSVEFSDETTERQLLLAPDVSADETLEFEVTVSDGEASSKSSVSITVEDLSVVETISEPVAIAVGAIPGGATSERSLVEISSLSQPSLDQYRVHWSLQGNFGSGKTYVASQIYNMSGERSETQSSGSFSQFFGPQSPIGVTIRATQSGTTLYNLLALIINPGIDEFQYALATHRGLVSDDIGDYGNEFTRTRNVDEDLYSFDSKALGDSQLLTVATFDLSSRRRNSVLGFTTASYVTETDGTTVETLISPQERDVEKTGASVAVLNDDSYFAFWSLRDSNSEDFDLVMQKLSKEGVSLTDKVIVSENNANAQIDSQSAAMQDGNVFVVWSDNSGTLGDQEAGSIKGRIIRPDGTFATAEFLINSDITGDQIKPIVHSLNANQVFVAWSNSTDQGASEIRGMVVNNDGSLGSNEFKIASSSVASNVLFKDIVVLPDNRLVLGWYNHASDAADRTSYTTNFFPLGR